MPEYLVSGRTPEGRQVVERVEAETASAAVEQLKKRGITEVVLHTDDISHIVSQQTQQQSNVPLSEVRKHITTRDSLTIMRDGTKLGRMQFLLRKSIVGNWALFIVPLIVVVIRHQQHQVWQLTDYLWIFVPSVYCLLWLPFWYAFLGPGATYHSLIDAGSWGRWDEVLRILPKLQGKISPHELACRKAEAISALGNLDAALEVVEPFADGQLIPLWMYHARLSSVYAWAHDFESSVRCCQMAAELAPNQATVLLDYA